MTVLSRRVVLNAGLGAAGLGFLSVAGQVTAARRRRWPWRTPTPTPTPVPSRRLSAPSNRARVTTPA